MCPPPASCIAREGRLLREASAPPGHAPCWPASRGAIAVFSRPPNSAPPAPRSRQARGRSRAPSRPPSPPSATPPQRWPCHRRPRRRPRHGPPGRGRPRAPARAAPTGSASASLSPSAPVPWTGVLSFSVKGVMPSRRRPDSVLARRGSRGRSGPAPWPTVLTACSCARCGPCPACGRLSWWRCRTPTRPTSQGGRSTWQAGAAAAHLRRIVAAFLRRRPRRSHRGAGCRTGARNQHRLSCACRCDRRALVIDRHGPIVHGAFLLARRSRDALAASVSREPDAPSASLRSTCLACAVPMCSRTSTARSSRIVSGEVNG